MAELLTGLEIKGYRQFEHFTMDGLRRVNLLVGRNNAGKTALLEAIQILTTRPALAAIQLVLERRSEVEQPLGSLNPHQNLLKFPLRHLFLNHQPPDHGEGLSILGHGRNTEVRFSVFEGWDNPQDAAFYSSYPDGGVAGTLKVIEDPGRTYSVPLDRRGSYIGSRAFSIGEMPLRFIGIEGMELPMMASLYDTLFELGEEEDVATAMKILEPRIQRLYFKATTSNDNGGENNAVLLDYGHGVRRPLGSAGEGMKRMLGLALALSSTKAKVLLIDEIDTGLHYSVMGDLWRLVTETAHRLDVQVFATTHSLDCVRGLESMRAQNPELFDEVAVHTIDVRRGRSVVATGEELEDAIQLGVELR